MMKKFAKRERIVAAFVAILLLFSLLPMTAFAADDTLKDVPIPKPAAPNYFIAGSAYETHDHTIRMVTVFDNSMVQLATEEDVDSEAFWQKYGVTNEGYYEFNLRMQYDVNIDGRGWQYTPAWDEDLYNYTGAYDMGYDYNGVREDLVSGFTLADTYWENTRALYGDMVYSAGQDEYGDDIWRFDLENHSAQVRCRYYMAYISNDEWVIRTGEWSDIAVIGKGSTQVFPPEPTGYAAPVISNMRVVPPGEYETEAHVYFELDTPDATWDAEVYYVMMDEWGLDELDAQISVDGGDWEGVYVANSHWPLYEGNRSTTSSKSITEQSQVKLRVRYGGPLGYSDWSNVLSVNAPQWSNASAWATAELLQAANLGLIPDVLQGADLTQDITRAEFAAVSVKVYEALAGEAAVAPATNPFTDTTDLEVLKAYNVGITNGKYDNGTRFAPDEGLNRQEAATMLTRVFKKVSFDGWTLATDSSYTLDYTKPAPFADDASIDAWAKDSVYFMAANGIINGIGDNKFAPKNTTSAETAIGYANATREQALLIAVRLVENLGE